MSEYSIQKNDFEKQKKELKNFANQFATSIELDKFSTDGQLFDYLSGGLIGGLSGHKVTGEELNKLVIEIQSWFEEISEYLRKVFKEFGQVYETFEALDKGYIQGICIGVESAEKAWQDAKEAQKDIDDTIEALQKTIQKLKEFKDEIKGYDHLADIDVIWQDVKNLQDLLSKVMSQIEKTVGQYEKEKVIFTEFMGSQKHFADIDSMWDALGVANQKIESCSAHINEYCDMVKVYNEKLSEIYIFIEKIRNTVHFDDIDAEWEYSHGIEKNLDKVNMRIVNAESTLSTYEEKFLYYEKENQQLKSRLNVVYIIAGSALGVSILQMILLLVGIL